MNLLVSYAACLRDFTLAQETLEWAHDLDGKLDNDCILSLGNGFDRESIIDAAKDLFRSVTVLDSNAPDTWPHGKNFTFQSVCRYLYDKKDKRPFLHWEPDSIPLCKGWLKTLEEEYALGGKPFGGFCNDSLKFMECVGIYPWNFMDYSPTVGMICRAAPWDIVAKADIYQNAHNMNRLMQFVHSIDGFAPTFKDLSMLQNGAVLFHRNKDGTLIDQLRKDRGLVNQVKKLFTRKSCPPVTAKRSPEAFFQLGRFGDLILLLPAFKEWADRTGEQVVVVVSEQYASVLEGVSYVRPLVVPHDSQTQAGEAWNFAKTLYPNIRRTQLHGAGLPPVAPRDLPSYSLSMWEKTGLPVDMYYRSFPVFDRRDAAREAELVKRCGADNGKVVLVNLEGFTSPLPCANKVHEMIATTFGKSGTSFVHTKSVGAKHIYDLLALMERAVGVLTIDTSTSHLAAASRVPTIHLVRDDGRAGSIPKGNVAAVIGYSQVQDRMGEIQNIVKGWLA